MNKATAVAWLAAGLLTVGALVAATQGYRPPPPCAAEDGGPYPCTWDGGHRGNGRGDRVVITQRP